MANNATLAKTRTVRLSAEIDRRIEARAAQKGRTPSDLIRDTLEAEFAETTETPGQWLLRTAKQPANRKPDPGFSEAWRNRHRQ